MDCRTCTDPSSAGPLPATTTRVATTRSTGNGVEDAFGGPWEVGEQTAAKADDHWFCHAEAANPAGERLSPARLDDRWPHDAERNVAAQFGHCTFGHGFGHGVGVAEVQRRGASEAEVNLFLADPAFAELLRLIGEGIAACSAEFVFGFFTELLERSGGAAFVFAPNAGSAGGLDLIAPVDRDGIGAVLQQFFEGITLAGARNVRG